MRTVVYNEYGGPEVLTVTEMEKPVPQDNEILIKVGGSALNPVDTYFRKGIRPVPAFPHIPHFDLGGVVDSVGKNITKVKPGDGVWATNISGTSAEYLTATQEDVFLLPDKITEVEGAAVAMPFTTAHLSLHYRANLQAGETVLVYGGAGAVGNAAIQLAKVAGATVIATAGNEEKADICREAGADHVILYKETDLLEKLADITGSEAGIDVILDMSLSENLETDLQAIKVGGRIVTIGSPVNNTPTLPWRVLNQKNAALLGILLFTAPKEEIRKAGEDISALLKNERVKPHVGATFTFEEAAEAHRKLEEKQVNGSIVLVP
ncbi:MULTISPECIES: NADPH:quinone reductase [Bacillaceae]|uniref:NADPH:quinone reductase n=1 Tax=Evansella alkalicola TaxID=745819 RepID=A0ABS6JMX9_9BACI|nr:MULTISPECIES: NADPH:quinone reductase [Bacillaceae]MBU9719912.1 NADPH:quinone reductase [Bacillus alkalicola]